MSDSLQRIIDQIDERMRERAKKAAKARKQGLGSWDTVYSAQCLGLIDARNIVLTEIERLKNETD